MKAISRRLERLEKRFALAVENRETEASPAAQGSSAAATTMLRIMVDSGAPASTRLRAADYVFSHAKHGVEIEDIDLRVAALDQAAERRR